MVVNARTKFFLFCFEIEVPKTAVHFFYFFFFFFTKISSLPVILAMKMGIRHHYQALIFLLILVTYQLFCHIDLSVTAKGKQFTSYVLNK